MLVVEAAVVVVVVGNEVLLLLLLLAVAEHVGTSWLHRCVTHMVVYRVTSMPHVANLLLASTLQYSSALARAASLPQHGSDGGNTGGSVGPTMSSHVLAMPLPKARTSPIACAQPQASSHMVSYAFWLLDCGDSRPVPASYPSTATPQRPA